MKKYVILWSTNYVNSVWLRGMDFYSGKAPSPGVCLLFYGQSLLLGEAFYCSKNKKL